jgi:hypothetical protein
MSLEMHDIIHLFDNALGLSISEQWSETKKIALNKLHWNRLSAKSKQLLGNDPIISRREGQEEYCYTDMDKISLIKNYINRNAFYD